MSEEILLYVDDVLLVKSDLIPILACWNKFQEIQKRVCDKVSSSPSQTSVWSVCRSASSASWSCRGGSCRNTAWPVGVALSSAWTADATWPWGTSRTTAGPARPLGTFQHCRHPPGNQVQNPDGCRFRGHNLERINGLVISPSPALSSTAVLSVTSGRWKASLSAKDLLAHKVLNEKWKWAGQSQVYRKSLQNWMVCLTLRKPVAFSSVGSSRSSNGQVIEFNTAWCRSLDFSCWNIHLYLILFQDMRSSSGGW